ncbi:MAG TPA: M17 family peptidase N-terminal domain-containing protein, partial [Candidatus Omnitrophota bacterium]|nr:M17 family peptidase N-terminal domain-containing protein [Candidatus Omnitrophota bacterium]
MIQFRSRPGFDAEASVIFLTEELMKAKNFKDFHWASLESELTAFSSSKQFSGKGCELFPLSSGRQIILLVGLGKEAELTSTAIRSAVRKAVISSYLRHAKSVELIMGQGRQDDETVIAMIEGVMIGGYAWKKYKKPANSDNLAALEKHYTIVASEKKAYHDAIRISEGVNLARDLVNDNADLVTSTYIEKTVKTVVKEQPEITLEILGPKELKAQGLNLHLAVNQGSANEPRLILIHYHGSKNKTIDAAIVGKGLTFDTGGLNLKTTGHIETMRTDMAGAAAVIGTLQNVIALKLKKNLLFVCAVAENAIGSKAYKPGDVITGYAGKSVEIDNTDAEGRLVLADALAYVDKNYKPKRIVDLATLTGACVVALGYDYSGLLSNDPSLAKQLIDAAQKTDDRVCSCRSILNSRGSWILRSLTCATPATAKGP